MGTTTHATSVLVRFPPRVKEAIVDEVERRQISMNDIVVSALAEHLGMSFQPSGRRPARPPSGGKQKVLLRMPPDLKFMLQVQALGRRSNLTDTIVRLMAEALGVDADIAAPVRTSPFGGGARYQ